MTADGALPGIGLMTLGQADKTASYTNGPRS
jgi:hypothetical protein